MGKMDKRWWPLREFQGRDVHHRNVEREAFVDTKTLNNSDKRTVFPENRHGEEVGWSGSPPNEGPGSQEHEASERTDLDRYRANYALIHWGDDER